MNRETNVALAPLRLRSKQALAESPSGSSPGYQALLNRPEGANGVSDQDAGEAARAPC